MKLAGVSELRSRVSIINAAVSQALCHRASPSSLIEFRETPDAGRLSRCIRFVESRDYFRRPLPNARQLQITLPSSFEGFFASPH